MPLFLLPGFHPHSHCLSEEGNMQTHILLNFHHNCESWCCKKKEGTTVALIFSSCVVWQIRRQKTCVVIHVQFYCLACVLAHMRGSRHDEVCRFHCRGTISFPCSIMDIICRGVYLDTFFIHINDNRKNGRVNLARHCHLIYVWSPRVIRTDLHGHIEHLISSLRASAPR